MKVYLIALFLISSCTIIKWANPPKEVKTAEVSGANKPFWLGRSSDDLILHPIFATKEMTRRKASNGQEVITFKNSGGREGRSGIGGSTFSFNDVTCNHVFYLQNDKITDYQRIGNCTEEEDPALRPSAPVQNSKPGESEEMI